VCDARLGTGMVSPQHFPTVSRSLITVCKGFRSLRKETCISVLHTRRHDRHSALWAQPGNLADDPLQMFCGGLRRNDCVSDIS